MSARRDESASGSIDDTAFLEHLPVPCIYLKDDYRIASANAAARNLIEPSNDTKAIDGTSSSWPYNYSIFDTNFAHEQLASRAELQDRLIELAAHSKTLHEKPANGKVDVNKASDGEQAAWRLGLSSEALRQDGHQSDRSSKETISSIRLEPAASASLEWTVTSHSIAAESYFCLTATEKRARSSWKDVTMTQDEEYEFLQAVAAPSWRDVPYVASLMSADKNTYLVNQAGHSNLSDLAATLEHPDPDRRYPNMWDQDFTVRMEPPEAAGPTCLKHGKGIRSLVRGIENPRNGSRQIVDTTCTLLANPYTKGQLGVIVQAREMQDWTEYLLRQDLYNRPNWTTAGEHPAMIRTISKDGTLDYFSESWQDLSGYTRHELLRGKWADCIHPEDLSKMESAVNSSVKYCHVSECAVRIRHRKDDTYRYFSDRTVPFRDEHDCIQRWYVVTTDIHDLLLKNKLAARANERLYNLVNNMPVTMFSIDKHCRVQSAEGAMELRSEDGTKHLLDDFIGQSMHELCTTFDSQTAPRLSSELDRIIEGSATKVVVDHHIGDRYLRTFAVPEIDADDLLVTSGPIRHGVLGLTMDLTAEKEHEEAIHKIEAMKETERLKDQFLANISHELRTPIAGLLGMTDLLTETELTHQQSDYVQTFQSSARSLLAIVNNILDFSKAEADAVVIEQIPFDLNRLLHDICNTNEVLALKKNLSFHLESPVAPMRLLGDPGRIRQMLQNLITNAIKFTSKGYIKLTATCERRGDRVDVTATVEDTGIGIDEHTLKLLFKPFVQADQSTTRVYGGSGLGLSIARKLAQSMGGDVVLESAKGRGTTSTITMRLKIADSSFNTPHTSRRGSLVSSRTPSDEKNMSTKPTKSNDQVHVLLVEDNLVNKKVVMAHLEKLGYTSVKWTANGMEALEYVADATSQTPDLILMDCQMPVLDGYSATRRLRSEYNYDGPVVALTASAIAGDRQKCLDAGMDDHMVKPINRKHLQAAVEKWIASGRHAS